MDEKEPFLEDQCGHGWGVITGVRWFVNPDSRAAELLMGGLGHLIGKPPPQTKNPPMREVDKKQESFIVQEILACFCAVLGALIQHLACVSLRSLVRGSGLVVVPKHWQKLHNCSVALRIDISPNHLSVSYFRGGYFVPGDCSSLTKGLLLEPESGAVLFGLLKTLAFKVNK